MLTSDYKCTLTDLIMTENCEIVLDTNFLLGPLTGPVDVLSLLKEEYPYCRLITLEGCIQEANTLKKGNYSGFVKKMMEKFSIEVIRIGLSGPIDEQLVELAKRGHIIATNDMEVRKKIRITGGRSIF